MLIIQGQNTGNNTVVDIHCIRDLGRGERREDVANHTGNLHDSAMCMTT